MPTDSDAFDAPARDADAILHRLFCLAALQRRGAIEQVQDVPPQRLLDAASATVAWLRDAGAADALSPEERILFHKPPRTWTKQENIDASWRMECEAVMAWSLGLIPLPAWDVQANPRLLMETVSVDVPAAEVRERVRVRQQLRPVSELAAAQEEAERWYWRATAAMPYFQKPQFGSPTKRAEMIRRALGEDVELFGKEYALLSPDEFWTARSIARERLYALNWIWDGEAWDEVLIDT